MHQNVIPCLGRTTKPRIGRIPITITALHDRVIEFFINYQVIWKQAQNTPSYFSYIGRDNIEGGHMGAVCRLMEIQRQDPTAYAATLHDDHCIIRWGRMS